MYCRVCGDENAKYCFPQRQALCRGCKANTPPKIGREEFDRRYWDISDDPPESTRREFYADYLASSYNYAEYAKRTTSAT